MAVIDFDTQILAATGQDTLPLAYEYLEANYYSNGNDFSAGVITALKD